MSIPENAEDVAIKGWPLYHKIGTVLGVTGLGLTGVTYVQNQRSNKIDLERKQIEAKSLAALQRIHKALAIKNPENI